METAVKLEKVIHLASKLSLLEKVKLIEAIAPQIEQEIMPRKPKKSLYGLWADLGQAPSAEIIDQARREAWAGFPREDI
jgi:hypothetical protein